LTHVTLTARPQVYPISPPPRRFPIFPSHPDTFLYNLFLLDACAPNQVILGTCTPHYGVHLPSLGVLQVPILLEKLIIEKTLWFSYIQNPRILLSNEISLYHFFTTNRPNRGLDRYKLGTFDTWFIMEKL
jgi:hypothetical protein